MSGRWKRRLLQFMIVPGVLVTGASCFFVTDSCACSEPAPSIVIHGTVSDSSGSVLEDVAVTLSMNELGCQEELATVATVASDSTGMYVIGVSGPDEGTTACAALEALRFLSTSVDTVGRTDLSVTFGHSEPLTVNLVFPVR